MAVTACLGAFPAQDHWQGACANTLWLQGSFSILFRLGSVGQTPVFVLQGIIFFQLLSDSFGACLGLQIARDREVLFWWRYHDSFARLPVRELVLADGQPERR